MGTMGEYRGKGQAVLTSKRLVVMNQSGALREFRCFALTYADTFQEMFGMSPLAQFANRYEIVGQCKPSQE